MSASIAIKSFDKTKYKITATGFGTWFEEMVAADSGDVVYTSKPDDRVTPLACRQNPAGRHREFISHAQVFGMPLVNISSGIDPQTGRQAVAKGFIGIGKWAAGVISIGQFATGYVSIGQFSLGRVLSIGQFSVAPISIGQFAIGGAVLGQIGLAVYGIFQSGFVTHGGIGQSIIHVGEFLRNLF